MDRMPSVSIVIPVYNRANLIGRCLESIFSQSIDGLEVIAVDDGSSDASLSVLEDMASCNPRLKVIAKENGGASSARNVGIKAAKGDYLMFVDSDDYLFEDSLRRGIGEAFSLNSTPDIVYFGFSRKGISGAVDSIRPPTRTYDMEETAELFMRFDQLFFGSPCFKLYRRSVMEEHALRFDETMTQYEDAVFNVSFIRYCQSAVSVGIPVYFYDCHTNVQSKMPTLFRGDGWISEAKKYYSSMVAYCKLLNCNVLGGVERAKYNTVWQVIPAIYGVYRSGSTDGYLWLRKIVDFANTMMPGWTHIPRSGFPMLVAKTAGLSPRLCHMMCKLIFSVERAKYKLKN